MTHRELHCSLFFTAAFFFTQGAFEVAFSELVTTDRKNILKKSNGFLKVVVNKFGTVSQSATTVRKTVIGHHYGP